ncbi:TIR domain-containing protein [Mariniflexile jejuense]|uniref:TIR domain-containing protein n=1 Tax=Mariniflexile jejuense TaxID=1173582 RepID=A0ABW3JLN9_9FLAO
MAKTNNQITKPTLTISNSDFKNQLSERIDIGEELFQRVINTPDDLDKLEQDYRLWNDYNREYLQQKFDMPKNEYAGSYAQAGYSFIGELGEVRDNPVLSKKNLLKYKLDNLKSLSAKSDLLKSSANNLMTKNIKINTLDMSKVFIVHGHDDLAKIETARFIEKLGFEPIILHEQASSGKTIIEKIESYSNVGFGIVLYTPCDSGSKKGEETNLKSRARQNVVFEHGFLIGKIGRKNVCALVKDNVETPNDISGVVYISMANDWKLDLAKELRNSGYKVDMNLVI